MTGWRIGFIAGPEWIVKGVNKLQGQYTSGPCSVSQVAAEVAYTGTQEPVEQMRQAFERRRDLIVSLAKEVPGFEVNVPEGAFYLFPKCSSFFGKSANGHAINTSDDLAMYLLEGHAHVLKVGLQFLVYHVNGMRFPMHHRLQHKYQEFLRYALQSLQVLQECKAQVLK